MAYMDQQRKSIFAEKIKILNKEFGIKATLSIRHYSTLVLKIRSGKIDFTKNSFEKRRMGAKQFVCEEANNYFNKAMDILNTGNYNDSDVERDYFDVGWYAQIEIGEFNKPYILVE